MVTSDEIKAASNPITEGLRDRFKDPFLNVFTLSAIVWNYQFFIYALSDLSPDTKIALILNSMTWLSFCGPLFTSIALNLVVPAFFWKAYQWAEKFRIKVVSVQAEEQLNLKTHKVIMDNLKNEIQRLQKDLSNKDQQIGQKSQKYLEQIEQHKAEIEEKENRIRNLKKETEDKINEIRTTQGERIDQILTDHNNRVLSLNEERAKLETNHKKEMSSAKKREEDLRREIKELKDENLSLQAKLSPANNENSETIATYNWLVTAGLATKFQNLYEGVLTNPEYPKSRTSDHDLAKFITKGLFAIETITTNFADEMTIVSSTPLAKLVYIHALENADSIPF